MPNDDLQRQIESFLNHAKRMPVVPHPVDVPLSPRDANRFKLAVCKRALSALVAQSPFIGGPGGGTGEFHLETYIGIFESFVEGRLSRESLRHLEQTLKGYTDAMGQMMNMHPAPLAIHCAATARYWLSLAISDACYQGENIGRNDITAIMHRAEEVWAQMVMLRYAEFPEKRYYAIYQRQKLVERSRLWLDMHQYRQGGGSMQLVTSLDDLVDDVEPVRTVTVTK